MNSVRAATGLVLLAIGIPAPIPREEPAERKEYVRQVESLRAAAAPWSASRAHSSDDALWKSRLDALDGELDALASARDGIGAPWMWTAAHRAELQDLVATVQPVLDEVVEHVRERGGRPLPETPKLMWSRHRTNLFCAAAIVSSTDEERLRHLEDALEAAQCVDDGSMIGWLVEECDFFIVADAALRISLSSQQSCDRLTADLVPRFASFMTTRSEALHLARFAADGVDEDWIRDDEPQALHDALPVLRRIETDILHPRQTGPLAADAETLKTALAAASHRTTEDRWSLLTPRR
jgi:hypothetical protein